MVGGVWCVETADDDDDDDDDACDRRYASVFLFVVVAPLGLG